MRIEVLQGPAAAGALQNSAFQQAWQELEARCPWGTVYQTWQFLSAWYQSYTEAYEPVLVAGWEGPALTGLLPLARPVEGGSLVVAGTYHAEYQAWIAEPESGTRFIEEALDALRGEPGAGSLLFTYLPPGTPTQWLEPGHRWASRSEHLRLPRPLASMGDGSSFKQSLRKKGNKSKVSRLERIGKLRLEQITDRQRLESLFDDIERFGTLRIGALRNIAALDVDPGKKRFYLQLMADSSLLHVTLLWAGEQLLSAHIGVRDRENVVLTIFTHAPFHARHSPGKLHLLYLGVLLAEQGIQALDLTPTGDYKDRFATHHDEVGRLQVFLTMGAKVRFRASLLGRTLIKNLLRRLGQSPDEAKARAGAFLQRAARIRLRDIPAMLRRRLGLALRYSRELRIYEFDVVRALTLSHPGLMNRDRLQDLLAYRPVLASEATVQAFLRDCLTRLEEGQHIYTHVQGQALAHYGWMIDRQERSHMLEVGQLMLLPADSAVLYGFYSSLAARNRGLYQAALRQMLVDAARIPGTRHIWISVLADNGASRHTIEKVGFTYRFSFFERKTLGRVQRWTNAPAEFVGAAAVPEPAAAEAVAVPVPEE
jgi:CelD/BcsL family acetyltransferase involved in cellulose biosynthesis/RimJ/RimL family protein N-acetyltransferase